MTAIGPGALSGAMVAWKGTGMNPLIRASKASLLRCRPKAPSRAWRQDGKRFPHPATIRRRSSHSVGVKGKAMDAGTARPPRVGLSPTGSVASFSPDSAPLRWAAQCVTCKPHRGCSGHSHCQPLFEALGRHGTKHLPLAPPTLSKTSVALQPL